MKSNMAVRVAGLILLVFAASASIRSKESIEGIWQGTLSIPGGELRVVFRISRTSVGGLTGAMDSPDQGATDIPVEEITFENGNLRLEVQSALGVFNGKMREDGFTVDGEWEQSGYTLPLVLTRVEKAPEVHRPQEPKKPYSYDEEEVFYENQKAGVNLAGTLTLPRSDISSPAVLLISGSGPQDRNEAVFGHQPFLVLADYLTRRGIVVLRVDDRGVGKSTGDFSQATSEDFAGDVLAGVQYLKNRKEINPVQIGLIGHSEGGIIAPMVASQSPDVAFIVLMAGTGLTGEEILHMQSALIGKAHGASDEAIAENRNMQERIFAVLKEEKDDKSAEEKLREIFTDALQRLSENDKEAMGFVEAGVEGQIQQVLSPWFRYFLTYDPKPVLRKVKCPVLAMIGEKDLQVPAKENLAAIEEALKDGGNKSYETKELPNLNHLFQTADAGSIVEYAKIEETISPTALDLIGNWILRQTEKKQK